MLQSDAQSHHGLTLVFLLSLTPSILLWWTTSLRIELAPLFTSCVTLKKFLSLWAFSLSIFKLGICLEKHESFLSVKYCILSSQASPACGFRGSPHHSHNSHSIGSNFALK